MTDITEVSQNQKPEQLDPSQLQLAQTVAQSGLQQETSNHLLSVFSPIAKTANDLIRQAQGVTNPKIARVIRLQLRDARIKVETVRKAAKEDSLKMGKAIDGVANVLKFLIEPTEKQLDDIEHADEIAEQARKDKLKEERENQLRPLGVNIEFYKLGEMDIDTFNMFLETSKLQFQAKRDAEEKLEQERIRIANEQAKEQERIRLENERLKQEAKEREAKIEQERKEFEKQQEAADKKVREERLAREAQVKADKALADKKLAEERKKRDAVEAKAKADRDIADKVAFENRSRLEAIETAKRKQEADNQARKTREDALKAKEERAPEKQKISAYGVALGNVALPILKTKEGLAATARIYSELGKLQKFIMTDSAKL